MVLAHSIWVYTSASFMELTVTLILILLLAMIMCFQNHTTWWRVLTPPSFSFHQNNLCPNIAKGKEFAGLEEAAHKDVEHAFGVLQSQWCMLTRPIELCNSTQ